MFYQTIKNRVSVHRPTLYKKHITRAIKLEWAVYSSEKYDLKISCNLILNTFSLMSLDNTLQYTYLVESHNTIGNFLSSFNYFISVCALYHKYNA